MFFAKEDNLKNLEEFIHRAKNNQSFDENKKKRLDLSLEIINSIHKLPEEWDKRCSFNIKHIGDKFLQNLTAFAPSTPEDINPIFCMSYRFLCEFDFFIGTGKNLSMELQSVKNRIQEDDYGKYPKIRSQIVYASYYMPVDIMKELVNSPSMSAFLHFEQKKNELENLKEQWDKELKEKKTEVINLKDKLNEYKIGFNFVGLNQGFVNLGKQKNKEASWLFKSLIAMGVLIIIPLATVIYITVLDLLQGELFSTTRLSVLLPIISIEAILIYFFRVILFNHKSVKAQKMQIELRQTLCQFIQSYAEYSVKIKKQDNKALEKFENLIFSGIISDSEKLPSTYDGLEQLSNLIKNVKSP